MGSKLFCTDSMFYSLNTNLIAFILGNVPTVLRQRRMKKVVEETAHIRRTLVLNIVLWLLRDNRLGVLHVSRIA